MKIFLILALCYVGVFAKSNHMTQLMQNMEYAMEQMQRGFLYNKKEWIDAGLNELKELNKQLVRIDSNVYLNQRRDMNVANIIVSRTSENIDLMEKFIKQNDMLKSADVYGRILTACVSCHAISW